MVEKERKKERKLDLVLSSLKIIIYGIWIVSVLQVQGIKIVTWSS